MKSNFDWSTAKQNQRVNQRRSIYVSVTTIYPPPLPSWMMIARWTSILWKNFASNWSNRLGTIRSWPIASRNTFSLLTRRIWFKHSARSSRRTSKPMSLNFRKRSNSSRVGYVSLTRMIVERSMIHLIDTSGFWHMSTPRSSTIRMISSHSTPLVESPIVSIRRDHSTKNYSVVKVSRARTFAKDYSAPCSITCGRISVS